MSSHVRLFKMERYFRRPFCEVELLRSLSSALISNWFAGKGASTSPLGIRLEDLHMHLPVEDVNDFRLTSLAVLNEYNWKEILLKNCYDEVAKLLGPDLLIQKRINLSVQMPGDDASTLPAHSDCSSGDSPFQLVIWIPLTGAFGTNSMFIYGSDESRAFYKCIKEGIGKESSPTEEDFLKTSLGEYILFSPSLIHGNVLNGTNATRVSLNIRVKALFSPYTPYVVSDRTIGSYYDVWQLTPLCQWASEVYEVLK